MIKKLAGTGGGGGGGHAQQSNFEISILANVALQFIYARLTR